MYLKVEGIVLRTVDYKETDVILTILTRNQGKLTAKARGVRKNRSPLKSAIQLLTYSEFSLRDFNGFWVIQEAVCLQQHPELLRDIESFGLGCYFSEVCELITEEDVANPEIFSLLMNSIYVLDRKKYTHNKVKAAFELKAACFSGYEPDLAGCTICGNPWADRFDIRNGSLVCSTCTTGGTGVLRMPISRETIQAMRFVISAPHNRFLSFRISGEAEREMQHITEAYLSTQLEHSFSSLDFYKSMIFIEQNGAQL